MNSKIICKKTKKKTPEEIEKIRRYNREYYNSIRKTSRISNTNLNENKSTQKIVSLPSLKVKIEYGSFIVLF
jgi:hypothetical protein